MTGSATAAESPAAALARVEARIAPLGSAIVALSGGVDSSVVTAAAVRALGAGRVLAVTAVSASLATGEADGAAAVAAAAGATHRVVSGDELDREGYRRNLGDRCFFCKDSLYGRLGALATAEGFAAVLGGANADDLGDHRPGLLAARDHGAGQPLAEAGVTKAEVRAIAVLLGLPSAAKPAMPCLSSRVAYGVAIDAALLARIDRAEARIRALGFADLRVRHFGARALVCVPAADLARAHRPAVRARLEAILRDEGWTRPAVDARPLRSGALNDALGLHVRLGEAA